MNSKQLATAFLIIGAILIIVPMILNQTQGEMTGLLKSLTILGAGLEIFAAIYYRKSKKEK